ncbi:MAG: PQQ-like beta-propeller repeat protein [Actinobacteria bacterium]|nr:PQQ-like beta-propeller repeat protein [Actinomycetota bacterium]
MNPRTVRLTLLAALAVAACVALALNLFVPSVRRATSVTPTKPSNTPARVTERWRASFPVEVVGLPSVDEQGVVVTAGESQTIALSPNGDVLWTTAVAGALVNAPRLDSDLVLVAAKRAVVALNRASGAVVWSAPTAADGEDDNRANEPVVAGDTVVATTESGRAYGLDRATGAIVWSVELSTASTAEPAAGDGVVVVVGIAQWRALDPVNGATIWSGDLGPYGTSSPVVYADGARSLAAVATDEKVIAVDAHSGEAVWQADADQSELFQVPTVTADHELLVPDHWGRLAAFDAHDGAFKWRVDGPDGVAEFGAPAVLGPKLVALSLDEGGPRIAGPNGSSRVETPSAGHGVAVAPDGQLIVTTWDGPENYVVAYHLKVRNAP